MVQYIGTKIINALPMSRLDYNLFMGWSLPDDEDGSDEGYLVEYLDGGTPNTKAYRGYVSWSPKEQFNKAYNKNGKLTLGDALAYLKLGYKVTRKGWNGKGMYILIMDGYENIKPNEMTKLKHKLVEDTTITISPYIVMRTASGELQPGWLASQNDLLAEDWVVIY